MMYTQSVVHSTIPDARGLFLAMADRGLDSRLRGNDGVGRGNDGQGGLYRKCHTR